VRLLSAHAAILAVTVLVSGCLRLELDVDTVVGRYDLISVNGADLPVVLQDIEFSGDDLVLNEDDTFTLVFEVGDATDPESEPIPSVHSGTYTADGSTIELTVEHVSFSSWPTNRPFNRFSVGTYTGIRDGNRVTAEDFGMTFVFRK
jgi:hypothetical protein